MIRLYLTLFSVAAISAWGADSPSGSLHDVSVTGLLTVTSNTQVTGTIIATGAISGSTLGMTAPTSSTAGKVVCYNSTTLSLVVTNGACSGL